MRSRLWFLSLCCGTAIAARTWISSLLFCRPPESGPCYRNPPCPAPDPRAPTLAAFNRPLGTSARAGRVHSRPSSNKRHLRPRQPVKEAAGRRARSFRYTSLVSSSQLQRELYPCFRSSIFSSLAATDLILNRFDIQ
ncbi:hypothetical protein N658DRAFT_336366 [Parathielavia hyrcaniae]|uniref:Secreted protein n=1 Tax=Parathielavia hyrcaniae TaxID=113614 RepID=A0AAN6Q7G8_9PEZI|nr:hypothetical protein N658DRAFT_336366 [Parathielavia hyrcaniae]